MNVFFAGGGSGGHLYPALAIARAMVAADQRVRPFFIGAKRGVERNILPTTEFPFELLDLHPLYRSRPWMNWRTMVGGATGWRRVSSIVAQSRPCALVATGGYASAVALGYAAAHGIPIVIQDQNSFPGLTVRWFARRATQIHLGFPEAASLLRLGPRTQVFASGNPVEPPAPLVDRPDRATTMGRWGFENAVATTILVSGASQGAEAINRIIGDWLSDATTDSGHVNLIWSTGLNHYARYAHLERPNVRVLPYIAPIRDAYMAADIAITRAGAMTTAELAAWGIPAILVPLPTAAADHQTANARTIATSGAAVVIAQSALNRETLDQTIRQLLSDPQRLQSMRVAALQRGRPNAARDIASHILEMPCFS